LPLLGKTIADVAKLWNKDPIDTIFDLLQELMRHANAAVTLDRYVQAVTPAKRKAQRAILEQLAPDGPRLVKSSTASC